MKRNGLRIVGVAAALSLVGAACASESDDAASTTTTVASESSTTMDGMDMDALPMGIDTGASELRSALTNLLQEHVYLAGIAISTAVGDGLEAPSTTAAVETLDANSVALSEAIAGIYGDEAGEQFLALWRDHITMFVDYTAASAGGDQAAADEAKAELDSYKDEFAAFIDSATDGELAAETTSENLQMHIDTLVAAIDAVVAGSPEAFGLLQTAAGHMSTTAAALSGAIVTQMPDEFDGEVDAPAAELRAGLTALLQEHVYLAGIAISTAVGDGLEAPSTTAAVETLDANSVALSEAIAGIYGDEAGEQFLALWRDHITMFVDYTAASAGGDQAAADEAKAELDSYKDEFAAFIDSATDGELAAETTSENLQMHIDTLVAAIDALVAGSPEVFPELRTAAQHMPSTAQALSGAIVAQMPDQFGS
ncbi:hypothetical protein [Rhabdothermincola salaria]|uniref:hypothetical protein n=1 Tax=Rhabdothermincola salaria TaxID=2903142 RepID=UPI001E44A97B|nr:hypothetical protein [Rhabdothermincola salaria]MCD9624513.1 hypothetical protein [Rhabdothermincola salaria]